MANNTMVKPVMTNQPSNFAIDWFTDARLGMFIHFGLYSTLARKSEWVMRDEQISRKQYRELMRSFNPTQFDAKDWVKAAIKMGAKYICITAKHCDGFCLWDSEYTDYKVTNTPFQRDLIEELVDACHCLNFRIELYYSLLDWYHPAYVNTSFPDWEGVRPDDQPNWPVYQKYVENQIRELCTKYGKIDGIWWDGGETKTASQWNADGLYRMIKSLQPEAIINNRSQIPADYQIGERRISIHERSQRLFENCESLGVISWGYIEEEIYQSPELILKGIIQTMIAGGNYLLNVGPKANGIIPLAATDRLKAIGNWMDVHSESIMDSQYFPAACCYVRRKENHSIAICASRENKVFIFVYERPLVDSFVVFGLRSMPSSACIRSSEAKIRCVEHVYGLEIKEFPLDDEMPFPSVIELTFDGIPDIDSKLVQKYSPSQLTLSAHKAMELFLGSARVIGLDDCTPPLIQLLPNGEPATGWWGSKQQMIAWDIRVLEDREYEVDVYYSVPECSQGATYSIDVAGNLLHGSMNVVSSTGSDYVKTLGSVQLPTGNWTFTLRPQKLSAQNSFGDIRKVVLRPFTR